MVGDDEARARATLVEMQAQLSQGPHIALQIAELATPEQVRRAFLELTKQFHPARFARMSTEIQRLANEVFLGIKGAHDSMLRALGASTRPGGGPASVATPILPSDGTNPARSPSGSGPVARPNQQISALARQPGTSPGIGPRAPTPPKAPRSPTPATGIPIARSGTPPHGVVVPRTLTPGATRPLGSRPSTPPSRPPTPPSRPTPMPQQQPLPRAGTPRTTDELNPGTIRYAGTPTQRTAPVFDERVALQEALDLMTARNWSAARQALHALAARVPQSKPYRALLCYARGREAQIAGKADDAALEFQRALQLDPELVQAKLALSEVKRR